MTWNAVKDLKAKKNKEHDQNFVLIEKYKKFQDEKAYQNRQNKTKTSKNVLPPL